MEVEVRGRGVEAQGRARNGMIAQCRSDGDMNRKCAMQGRATSRGCMYPALMASSGCIKEL